MRKLTGILIMLGFLFGSSTHAQANLDELLNHELKRLHANETVDLRSHFEGKPLLFVNTASHCGFTGQFEDLEALYQRYKDQGLMVAGFPSNSFRQEASDEEETARVCFYNFGVTFDMFSPIDVRGNEAHPIFAELARQSSAPKWNFYKYLIDREGNVVDVFPSTTNPNSTRFRRAIERLLEG